MIRITPKLLSTLTALALLCALAGQAHAEAKSAVTDSLPSEQESPVTSRLEALVQKVSNLKHKAMDGFASYYARRFEGKKTTSGQRYHPEKLTGAHQSLPLGTVVRVVNPATSQEVHVTITDRCGKKPFPFIDLSRAAAKKIGLWGKGKMKVVIIPLIEENLEEPT